MVRETVAPILSKDFVTLKIDVDRTVGGKEVFEILTGGKSAGLPWIAILNPDGSVVADSFGPDGNNIGSPYTDEEIAYFEVMMKASAKNMTPSDIITLAREFVAARESGNK